MEGDGAERPKNRYIVAASPKRKTILKFSSIQSRIKVETREI